MALKVNSTTIFDNAGSVPIGRITFPGLVSGVSIATVGDGTNPYGTSYAACSSATFSGGVIYMTFNTNCACTVCDCNCVCTCSE